MSTLPTFSPEPPPTIQIGKRLMPDMNALPPCVACGRKETVDVESRTCRECWRSTVLARAVIAAEFERWFGKAEQRKPYEPKPLPPKGGPTS